MGDFIAAIGAYGDLIVAFFTVVMSCELLRFGMWVLRGGR